MSNPKDYSVGWICAITTEYVAAQEFLDEEHDGPEYVSPNDNNHYTLGRVGRHNVVIAVLPDNEYGKSSAAGVARDMLHSFPNVRIGLMVGIGGGAPGKHDIRLGDIVVSSATSNGGVLGYDFGKDVQGHDFQVTGFLNQPPTILRTAMSGLKACYERKGHQLTEAVNAVLNQNKRLRKKYKQPETATDQLFKSAASHDMVCAAQCRYDASNLVSRQDRAEYEDYPVIHYGRIASADRLLKNAVARDRLSEEYDVLCFEMEASGLVNHFPCLVIRGICDYSDSHKNKDWQGYAAMLAAAYAKDLLNQIAPNRVQGERKISDSVSGLHEVVQEHYYIAKEQLQTQKALAAAGLSVQQHKCHQLFRLTNSSRDATYEWYKSRVEERVEGTCMWFLKHNHFQTWLMRESGPLLVSADPGCGKSVLAKYLIDQGLPRSASICYFFFKDEDQDTIRQAVCALLHQLFSLKPSLIEHAMPQFHKDGKALINSTESLWRIFHSIIKDPQTGPVIVVLDALDECAEAEFADLIKNVKEQFQPSYGKLKFLLTCRPYNQVLSEFRTLLHTFPEIHIPGEEQSETIAQEVNHVIRRRVHQLAMKKRFPTQIKNYLEKRLQECTHRTYLWVYLVFDYLQKEVLKKTVNGIESAIATLPMTVNQAYERILNKANKAPIVLKILSIILAARRPLTLSEMNIAVNVDIAAKSLDDLDLEDEDDFKESLRSLCGLFVSIHHGKVYLLHQTAREFLLADIELTTNISPGLLWHRSITNKQAHNVLLNICLLYLNFFTSDATSPPQAHTENSRRVNKNVFLNYSSRNWATHLRQADITDSSTTMHLVRRLFDKSSKYCQTMFGTNLGISGCPGDCADLIVASDMGLPYDVKLCPEHGMGVEVEDSFRLQTSLSWAVWEGHESVVKLLIEEGANVNANVESGERPLHLAVKRRQESFVDMLLEGGAEVNYEVLCVAISEGHNAIVKLLLEKGDYSTVRRDDYRQTPLHVAAAKGNNEIIKLLLEKGAYIDEQNGCQWTPLCSAIHSEHDATVKLLIQEGAVVHVKDGTRRSPLSVAVHTGNEDMVKLVLDNGAFLEYETIYRRYAPITQETKLSNEATVRLLLDK